MSLCALAYTSCQKEPELQDSGKFNYYFDGNTSNSYKAEAPGDLLTVKISPLTVRFLKIYVEQTKHDSIFINELPQKGPTIRFYNKQWGPVRNGTKKVAA